MDKYALNGPMGGQLGVATAHSFLFRVADPGFHCCCLRLLAQALIITVGTDDQSSHLLPTSTSVIVPWRLFLFS